MKPDKIMLEEHICYQVDKLIDTGEIVLGKEGDRVFINFPSNNEREIYNYFYHEILKSYEFVYSSFGKEVDLEDYLVERLNISYQDAVEIERYFVNLAQK